MPGRRGEGKRKGQEALKSHLPKALRHFPSSSALTFPMPASRRWWNSSLPPAPPPWHHCPGQRVGAVVQAGTRRGRQSRTLLVGNREYVIETLLRGEEELPRQDHTRAEAPCHSAIAPFSCWRKHTSPTKYT